MSFRALAKETVVSDLKAVATEGWRKDRGHYGSILVARLVCLVVSSG
jgi:hypothetical protein